jgi:hypothetical protein
MSKALKIVFLVHAVLSAVAGAILLIVPGRFLELLQWAPIDPLLTRVLGAALLALAWTSFYGWREADRKQLGIIVQMEAICTVLACVGLLRHLAVGHWPWQPWLVFAVFAVFALAWILFLIPRRS